MCARVFEQLEFHLRNCKTLFFESYFESNQFSLCSLNYVVYVVHVSLGCVSLFCRLPFGRLLLGSKHAVTRMKTQTNKKHASTLIRMIARRSQELGVYVIQQFNSVRNVNILFHQVLVRLFRWLKPTKCSTISE